MCVCVCVCARAHVQVVATWTGGFGAFDSLKRQDSILERGIERESGTRGLCPGCPQLGDLAFSDVFFLSGKQKRG